MFERLKDRVERRAIALIVVVPVAFCVVAFLALAGYFALRESLSPAMSALVTAAGGIVVIAVVMLFTRIAARTGLRQQSRQQSPQGDMPDQIEELLQQHADPVLRDWIRNNPDRAVIATLVLGVAAGYSKSFQKILLDMYTRYSEAETRRRSDRHN